MQLFFKLRTRSSALLGVGPDGVVTTDAAPAMPVLLLRPVDRPTLGFMVAASGDDLKLTVTGVACRTAIQPWHVRQNGAGFTLYDPATGSVLTERSDGTVATGSANDAGAAIQLEAVPSHKISAMLTQLQGRLAAVLPANLNGPDMLDALDKALTPETAEVSQAVLRLLPRDQMEWLGSTILGLPSHLARFAAAYPGDIWASRALPDLRQWLQTRKAGGMLHLPPEWDFLAEAGLNGNMTTAAHMLSAAARAAVPPRRPVCVVATARNEGLYLLEWIAYHRLIGAEALFIYSNDNSDGSDDLLRALALAGEITWIDNSLDVGRGAQPKAYGHAFGVLPGVLEYRWALVIDLDEFFGFDVGRFRSLPDYIAWQDIEPLEAIAINWRVFGSGGASTWTNAPLVERFTKALPWPDPHTKTLSRVNRCVQSHPHYAVFQPGQVITTRDADGLPFEYSGQFAHSAQSKTDSVWIAHYFLKSAEEFVWKLSRNRGDHAVIRDLSTVQIDPALMDLFIKQHTSPTMVTDERTLSCAPGLRAEIDRLRQLPGIAAAETRITRNYTEQLSHLVRQLRSGTTGQANAALFHQLAGFCQ